MNSPSKKITAALFIKDRQLAYSINTGNETVIKFSNLGVDFGGVKYGVDVDNILIEQQYIINETNNIRGNVSKAINHCNVYEISVKNKSGNFIIEFRLYNNGCAFRYLIKGGEDKIVKGEMTSFNIPAYSSVWFFERDNAWKLKSYAGWWKNTVVDSLPIISKSASIQGKPLVVKLPSNKYVLLTEAALYNYSGMRFKAVGNNIVQANFTEEAQGFSIKENLISPWRVVLVADDLNALVNNNVIANLNPKPDKNLYKGTSYIKEGKSVWSWITRKENYMQPEEEKRFIDAAAKLNFQYTMLDEGWETIWTDKWKQLKEICSYGASKNISVWVWKDSKWLRDARVRDLFLDSIITCGVVGIKTDFMNSEAKELIDFEIDFLKATAKRKLMVNFHGCQAPTGEAFTYPNEMTREGIRGMELNIMKEPIPPWHNAALPFTRFMCGHGDYTPALFSNKGNTTYTHQLALLYLFNSPLQTIAENPVLLVTNSLYKPIIPLLQTLPVTWDETVVLEGSDIGKMAAFAKRKNKDWYVAVINGTEAAQDFLLKPFFLKKDKKYMAIVITDEAAKAFTKREIMMKAADKKHFVLPATGGLVIKITEAN